MINIKIDELSEIKDPGIVLSTHRDVKLIFSPDTCELKFVNSRDVETIYKIQEFVFKKFPPGGKEITLEFKDHIRLGALKMYFDKTNFHCYESTAALFDTIINVFENKISSIQKSSTFLFGSEPSSPGPSSSVPSAFPSSIPVVKKSNLLRITMKKSEPLASRTSQSQPVESNSKTEKPPCDQRKKLISELSPNTKAKLEAAIISKLVPMKYLLKKQDQSSSNKNISNNVVRGRDLNGNYQGPSRIEESNMVDFFSVDYNPYSHRSLKNVGNSCFLNSTLQAVSAIAPFTARMQLIYTDIFVLNQEIISHFVGEPRNGFELLRLICTTLSKLTRQNGEKSENDENISKNDLERMRELFGIRNTYFRNSYQQDAHEFLIILLQNIKDIARTASRLIIRKKELEKENISGVPDYALNKISAPESGLTMNPIFGFQTKTLNRVFCEYCEYEEFREEVHNNFDVPLRPGCDLQQLFDKSFPCTRQKDFKCERCKKRGRVVTSRKIQEFPETLLLNLTRYQISSDNEMRMVKKDSIVPVCKYLYASNLTKYQMKVEEDSDPMMTSKVETPYGTDISKVSNESATNSEEKKEMGMDLQDEPTSSKTSEELMLLKMFGKNGVFPISKNYNNRQILGKDFTATITFKPFVSLDGIITILEENEIRMPIRLLRTHLNNFPMRDVRTISKFDRPKKIHNVIRDRNSFYRSISWWLTGDEKFHLYFRRMNATILSGFGDFFSRIVGFRYMEDALDHMLGNYEHSTDIDVIVMCTLLDLDIFVYNNKEWKMQKPRNFMNPRESFWQNELFDPRGAVYLTQDDSMEFNPVLYTESSDPVLCRKRLLDKSYKKNDDEIPPKTAKLANNELEKESGEKLEKECERVSLNKGKDEGSINWDRQPVYELDSVVCHQGPSPNSGHYIAYIRESDGWVYCSDEEVFAVEESEALRRASETGYLFFFSRIEKGNK